LEETEVSLVQADAVGLEIRVAAFLSQDPVLLTELRDGLDIHTDNQTRFGLPTRLSAKVLVFRLLYGANEFSFANDPEFTVINKSKQYWKEVIEAYYSKYKGIKTWHTNLVREAVQTGKVVSPTGREYIFQKYNGEYKDTQIKNYVVQGTGADLMALARVSFYNRLKKLNLKDCLLVNTVHDSIVLDMVPEHVEVVGETLHNVFNDIPANFKKLFGVEFNCPMEAEVLVGEDWENMNVLNKKS
jgi:DNA polymerase I-like protein with 3'-5' exonuclease and polymerase domains